MTAGLKLFLDRGISQVTIDDITREAGMAKGNFYRYFEGKKELVDAILQPIATNTRQAMRQCAIGIGKASDRASLEQTYGLLALSIATTALNHLGEVQLYLQEHRAPPVGAHVGVRALADELGEGAIKLTRIATDHGLLQVDDPRVSALAVVGAVEQLTLTFLRKDIDVPPDQIARIVINMVLEGIRR